MKFLALARLENASFPQIVQGVNLKDSPLVGCDGAQWDLNA